MKFTLSICLGLIGPLVGYSVYVSDVSRRPPVGSVYWPPQSQRPSTSRPPTTSTRPTSSPPNNSSRQDLRDPDGDSIVGVAGEDYPVLARIPRTNFSCSDYPKPGYYVDVEAQCQVFHICQKNGGRVSFLCPNGTVFNQNYFVCDWWYNIGCGSPSSSSLSAISTWDSEVLQEGGDSDSVVVQQQGGNFSTVSEPPSVSRRRKVVTQAHERPPPLSQAFF